MKRPSTRLPLFVFACSVVIAGALLASHSAVPVSAGTEAMLLRDTVVRVEDDAMLGLVESEEEAAYPTRRLLYEGGHIGYNALDESKQACRGSCLPPGQPYRRGCKKIYYCPGGS